MSIKYFDFYVESKDEFYMSMSDPDFFCSRVESEYGFLSWKSDPNQFFFQRLDLNPGKTDLDLEPFSQSIYIYFLALGHLLQTMIQQWILDKQRRRRRVETTEFQSEYNNCKVISMNHHNRPSESL